MHIVRSKYDLWMVGQSSALKNYIYIYIYKYNIPFYIGPLNAGTN